MTSYSSDAWQNSPSPAKYIIRLLTIGTILIKRDQKAYTPYYQHMLTEKIMIVHDSNYVRPFFHSDNLKYGVSFLT